MHSHVVIEHAPKMNYRTDYVALPKNYGTQTYYRRPDIQAIQGTVRRALDSLHEKTGIGDAMAAFEKVIIKPNLVNVFHNSGYYDASGNTDFPETTDPRVFDAVVGWVLQYNPNIIIAESSGKPFPTSASFHIAGYDRIAERYGLQLVCLEREPVVRYYLPKAEVMREILIPRLFDDVVRKRAFYISVPKMKTNIYTQVTLSFKNAMGTIPYFLRERNHTHDINKKLADMLYLFQPDLVLIDGIIGGEGNTPAPVDPVDVGMIVASNHSVEADRVTTYMMGFDPASVPLMQEVDKRGFADPAVQIHGEVRVVPFRPASPSLMRGCIHEKYPNVLALAGHELEGSKGAEASADVEVNGNANGNASVQYAEAAAAYAQPTEENPQPVETSAAMTRSAQGSVQREDTPANSPAHSANSPAQPMEAGAAPIQPADVTADIAFAMEQSCVGGCLSSVAMGFEAASYGPRAERHFNTSLIVLEGPGIVRAGTRYWFDREGRAYTENDIRTLRAGGQKVLAMGKCVGACGHALADFSIKGCCDPAECLNAVSNSLGIVTDQLNPVRNKSLLSCAVPGLLATICARTKWVLCGHDVDVPRRHEDMVYPTNNAPECAPCANYEPWPLEPLSVKQRLSRCADMLNLMDSLTGMPGMLKHYR